MKKESKFKEDKKKMDVCEQNYASLIEDSKRTIENLQKENKDLKQYFEKTLQLKNAEFENDQNLSREVIKGLEDSLKQKDRQVSMI